MKQEKQKQRKSTSCGALPWRIIDGKLSVLLIKQFPHKDAWGIPKGHINDGETLEQCAVREVMEETGVTVMLERKLPPVITNFRNEEKTVHSWLATCQSSDQPKHDGPNSEVADARWFEADALPRISGYQQSLVAEALKILNESMNGKIPSP